jgi:branched-chain amino acid transport system permease protein
MPSKLTAAALAAVLVVFGTRVTGLDVLLLTRSFTWAILALSAWFLLRVSGRASLGNAAFFGTSAYVVGVSVTRWELDNFWVVLGIAIAASAAVGVVVGLVSGRLSGVHFLLITLAFAELLRSLAVRWSVLGGENGIAGITRPSAWPLGVDLTESETMMWFAGGWLAVVVVGLVVVLRSPFGAHLVGVRDSETRMAALGASPVPYRVTAVVLASVVAGVAGVLNAYAVRFVSPTDVAPLVSAKALLFTAIGGVGMVGAIVASVVMTFLEDDLSSRWDSWPTVLGGVYLAIAMIGTRPRTAVGSALGRGGSVATRRRPPAPTPAPAAAVSTQSQAQALAETTA